MMDINEIDGMDSRYEETIQIQKIAFYGFLLNLGLTGLKSALAFLSGSLSITASAVDSATDSVASLVLYVGLKLSNRKTSVFPLGLYKIENLLSVAMAFFIFFAGYEIAHHAFSPVIAPPDISVGTILLISSGAIATFIFGQYVIAAGRRTESPTLIAEGRHRQADVLSSLVVVISISISHFNLNIDLFGITVDQISAVLVLLFVAHTGWELLVDGMRNLLDASIDHETLTKIQKIIESESLVTEIRSLIGRNAGRFRFLQAVVSMRTNDLHKAHTISKRIESSIRHQVPHVESVIIHYEPQTQEYIRIAVPLSDKDGKLSGHLGDSSHFAILLLRAEDQQIIEQEVVKNPYRDLVKGKGIRVAEWLVEKNIDQIALTEEIKNKGPGYVFTNAGVKIHVIHETSLEKAISFIAEQNRFTSRHSAS